MGRKKKSLKRAYRASLILQEDCNVRDMENKPITKGEQIVLDLIRSKDFQNITINVNDGEVVLVRQEQTFKPVN